MLMLQFQMEIGLFFKVMFFPFVFLFHRLIMAIDVKCCRSKCYKWRSVSEDLEIDAEQKHRQFYLSNYASACNMKIAKAFYPIKQWSYWMYKDRNPYVHYLRCHLCNEPFNMFQKIILPPGCKSRTVDKVQHHYFHVCCIDILVQEQELYSDNYQKIDNIDCKVDCLVCTM